MKYQQLSIAAEYITGKGGILCNGRPGKGRWLSWRSAQYQEIMIFRQWDQQQWFVFLWHGSL